MAKVTAHRRMTARWLTDTRRLIGPSCRLVGACGKSSGESGGGFVAQGLRMKVEVTIYFGNTLSAFAFAR